MQKIKHKNIIEIKEILNDDSNNSVFCIFEFFPCKNLAEILHSEKVLKSENLQHILHEVLKALQYLHSQKICHRDVTLSNILISDDLKTVKLIDFGIAKELNAACNYLMSPVGRNSNLPPEFETSGYYDTKFDIWLTGLVLLQMIYRISVSSKKALQIIKKITENPSSFPLDESCSDLIFKLLAQNPDQRISADEALSHIWFEECREKELKN